MSYRIRLLCSLLFSACTSSHATDVGDDTVAPDAPPVADTSVADVPRDAGSVPVICGGSECAAGELCCVLTGECASADGGPCSAPDDAGSAACASNADCDPDEFCRSASGTCIGLGTCTPRDYRDCDSVAPHCGCDGRTYRNACDAERAGVRVAPFAGECGAEGPEHPPTCGRDADCPGTACCHITGLCLPVDCPDCCFDPTGHSGFYPCGSDAYCRGYQSHYFCNADSCDGPGVCAPSSVTCDGTLDPVCGCDGLTYTSASCAQDAAVRTAHPGECEP